MQMKLCNRFEGNKKPDARGERPAEKLRGSLLDLFVPRQRNCLVQVNAKLCSGLDLGLFAFQVPFAQDTGNRANSGPYQSTFRAAQEPTEDRTTGRTAANENDLS